MPITNEQIQELQAMVTKLVADKADADAKTAASHQKDTEATVANAAASQAKLEEAAADALANADLSDLRSFVDSLAEPTP